MAVTYSTTAKNAKMTALRDLLAGGTMEIQTSGAVVLAAFALTATGGTVTNGEWRLEFTASTVNASATGTAAQAVIKDSTGTAHVTGLTVTATGGGGDIEVDNTSIASGQSVTMSSMKIIEG